MLLDPELLKDFHEIGAFLEADNQLADWHTRGIIAALLLLADRAMWLRMEIANLDARERQRAADANEKAG